MAKAKERPRPLFGFGEKEGEATPSEVAQLTVAAIQDLERIIDRQREALQASDRRVAELAHRQADLVARVATVEALIRDLARG